MTYPPRDEEVKILQPRHAEMSEKIVRIMVEVADRLCHTPELTAGLSVRATDEVCTYRKHPIIATNAELCLPTSCNRRFAVGFKGSGTTRLPTRASPGASSSDASREKDCGMVMDRSEFCLASRTSCH
jgi:hypothetical protein